VISTPGTFSGWNLFRLNSTDQAKLTEMVKTLEKLGESRCLIGPEFCESPVVSYKVY
jgi:hypothetical protein